MTNIKPGDLTQAISFSIMTEAPDPHGGHDQVPTAFTTRAHFRFLRGGETVQAARLEGRQPVIITVRRNDNTRQIDTSSKLTDTRTGTVYNVRAIVPTDDRKFLEITAESGVAT